MRLFHRIVTTALCVLMAASNSPAAVSPILRRMASEQQNMRQQIKNAYIFESEALSPESLAHTFPVMMRGSGKVAANADRLEGQRLPPSTLTPNTYDAGIAFLKKAASPIQLSKEEQRLFHAYAELVGRVKGNSMYWPSLEQIWIETEFAPWYEKQHFRTAQSAQVFADSHPSTDEQKEIRREGAQKIYEAQQKAWNRWQWRAGPAAFISASGIAPLFQIGDFSPMIHIVGIALGAAITFLIMIRIARLAADAANIATHRTFNQDQIQRRQAGETYALLTAEEASQPDPFEVLGVKTTANDDEINQAFKRLARKVHPDVGGSEEEFKQIDEARKFLLDPARRRDFVLKSALETAQWYVSDNLMPSSSKMDPTMQEFRKIFGAQGPTDEEKRREKREQAVAVINKDYLQQVAAILSLTQDPYAQAVGIREAAIERAHAEFAIDEPDAKRQDEHIYTARVLRGDSQSRYEHRFSQTRMDSLKESLRAQIKFADERFRLTVRQWISQDLFSAGLIRNSEDVWSPRWRISELQSDILKQDQHRIGIMENYPGWREWRKWSQERDSFARWCDRQKEFYWTVLDHRKFQDGGSYEEESEKYKKIRATIEKRSQQRRQRIQMSLQPLEGAIALWHEDLRRASELRDLTLSHARAILYADRFKFNQFEQLTLDAQVEWEEAVAKAYLAYVRSQESPAYSSAIAAPLPALAERTRVVPFLWQTPGVPEIEVGLDAEQHIQPDIAATQELQRQMRLSPPDAFPRWDPSHVQVVWLRGQRLLLENRFPDEDQDYGSEYVRDAIQSERYAGRLMNLLGFPYIAPTFVHYQGHIWIAYPFGEELRHWPHQKIRSRTEGIRVANPAVLYARFVVNAFLGVSTPGHHGALLPVEDQWFYYPEDVHLDLSNGSSQRGFTRRMMQDEQALRREFSEQETQAILRRRLNAYYVAHAGDFGRIFRTKGAEIAIREMIKDIRSLADVDLDAALPHSWIGDDKDESQRAAYLEELRWRRDHMEDIVSALHGETLQAMPGTIGEIFRHGADPQLSLKMTPEEKETFKRASLLANLMAERVRAPLGVGAAYHATGMPFYLTIDEADQVAWYRTEGRERFEQTVRALEGQVEQGIIVMATDTMPFKAQILKSIALAVVKNHIPMELLSGEKPLVYIISDPDGVSRFWIEDDGQPPTIFLSRRAIQYPNILRSDLQSEIAHLIDFLFMDALGLSRSGPRADATEMQDFLETITQSLAAKISQSADEPLSAHSIDGLLAPIINAFRNLEGPTELHKWAMGHLETMVGKVGQWATEFPITGRDILEVFTNLKAILLITDNPSAILAELQHASNLTSFKNIAIQHAETRARTIPEGPVGAFTQHVLTMAA